MGTLMVGRFVLGLGAHAVAIAALIGAPWPPTITASNGTTSFSVSVSDQSCAESDHSAQGDVVSCDAYAAVTQALMELLPEQGPYPCESYW